MKIVHLCLGNFFVDNQSYQENMLTKQHKNLGYDVEIIAGTQSFDEHGNIAYDYKPGKYLNEYAIPVTRIPFKKGHRCYIKFRRFIGLKQELERSKPDILFVHNCQFMDIDIVAKYAKEHDVTIYVDNHADFANSATNLLSKIILHGIIWRRCAHVINPYTRKFYGVLPARVTFLEKMYRLPKDKCELLVMGADDELVEKSSKAEVRKNIRNKYEIQDSDFLIMSGGKINQYRPETLNLLKAVNKLNAPNVKLLIFGMVSDEFKTEFDALCENNAHIIFAGWQSATATYDFIAAADLMVFPGLHSVMWEQAVAQGVPCLFKKIPGFDHVDIGGNAHLLEDVSVEGLTNELNSLLNDPNEYRHMKSVAKEKGMKVFSYREIARRSIEV